MCMRKGYEQTKYYGSFSNLITCFYRQDILAKTRSRMPTTITFSAEMARVRSGILLGTRSRSLLTVLGFC